MVGKKTTNYKCDYGIQTDILKFSTGRMENEAG